MPAHFSSEKLRSTVAASLRESSIIRIVPSVISGLILGKHEKFDDMGTGRQPYEILQEVMGDVDFPVLAEFDCCHTHPMLTVPIGAKVRLDADAQTVTLLEE